MFEPRKHLYKKVMNSATIGKKIFRYKEIFNGF